MKRTERQLSYKTIGPVGSGLLRKSLILILTYFRARPHLPRSKRGLEYRLSNERTAQYQLGHRGSQGRFASGTVQHY
jgi:hypothetical protein